MRASSCTTMINYASLTHWLIQRRNYLTTQELTFLESAVESVSSRSQACQVITDNVLQAQLGSTRPITYKVLL